MSNIRVTKLEIYKTNLGIFIKSLWGTTQAWHYRVNGIEDLPVNNGFVFLPGATEITTVEEKTYPKNIIVKYKLKDETLHNSPSIPLELFPEEVNNQYIGTNRNGDGYDVWQNYTNIQPLYEAVNMTTEAGWKPHENWEVIVLREFQIDSYNTPIQMKVKLARNDMWDNQPVKEHDLANIVYYEDIEKLLTPEFLIHERPCYLSSHQVYRIVRQWIIENIDPKVSKITSNHDFCFTVKRIVKIKPYDYLYEERTPKGNKYKYPKYKKSVISTKEVELFEMTYSGYNGKSGYNGYTIIDGWSASSLSAMKDQIDYYLENLMNIINAGVAECSHCNGHGHIITKVQTNKREFA